MYSQHAMQWETNYGGDGTDVAHSAIETSDGGFIIVGSTDSEGSGKLDGYVLKIDSKGNKDWEMTYGGRKDDEFFAIAETKGNYAICGYSDSKGSGGKDFWLLVIDQEGQKIWEYFYGYDKDEEAYDIISTYDGNLVMVGYTKSKGGGARDFYIIKVDPNSIGKNQGKEIWSRNIGGSGTDLATRVKQNPEDSMLYVIGHTSSYGSGGMDLYFTQLTPDRGSPKQKKYIGKDNFEHGNDFCFTENHGYLLVGGTMSDSKGYFDAWLYKIETEFYKEWEETYGGEKDEEIMSVFNVGDTYVLGGFTESIGEGKADAWFMVTDKTGKMIQELTFGEDGNDKIHRMIKSSDGGYLMIGETESKGDGKADFWIIKIK